MSWEVAYGIIFFTAVYGILKIVNSMKSDDQDNVKTPLMNGFKAYLIIITFLIILGGLVSLPNVIDTSISQSINASNVNQTSLDNVKTVTNTVYKGGIYAFIPAIFFMLILLIYSASEFLRGTNR